jgi:ATP-dependent DNA helicase RecQ
MKEQEPMGVLIDVLRGSQNAQIFEKGLQNIKTFGVVKDVSWQDLQQYVIQLLNQGVLEINFRENSRIALTPLAKQILYDKKSVQLAILNQVEKQVEKKTRTKADKKGLFEKLRVLRYQIAKEQGVPAYVVFGDASLKDMEAKQPLTRSEFEEVSGVGEAKLEKYADVFLKEIAEHIASVKPKIVTHEQTWTMFKEGLTPADIAVKRELTENTIYSHLMKMHSQGEEIDLHELVSTEELSKIEKAKTDLPEAEGLKAYFEYFEEKVPYWKIKIGLYLLDS